MQSTEGTESAAPIELPQAAERHPSPPRGGRLLGALGLLFGLLGLVAAGLLYYYMYLLYPIVPGPVSNEVFLAYGGEDAIDPAALAPYSGRSLAQKLDEALAEQARLGAELERLEAEGGQALKALRGDRELWRQGVEKALAQRLDGLPGRDPSAEREWLLAEVEFLLRMANRRLRMEWDLPAALQLLQAADEQLAALNEDGLHEVRAALAAEILRLRQKPAVDLQGLYLRLDAIKRQLATGPRLALKHALNAPTATRAPPPEEARPGEAPGFFAVLAGELADLVRFRRLDADFRAPPTAAESAYLELSLRLMLEQAQLAALKRDAKTYQASLDSALHWAAAHFDPEDPAVQKTIDAMQALRSEPLEASPPDISGSLQALRQARGAAG